MEKSTGIALPTSLVDSSEAFNALPRDEQLSRLVCEGEVLPYSDDEVSFYRVANYHVRVWLEQSPWRVLDVEAF